MKYCEVQISDNQIRIFAHKSPKGILISLRVLLVLAIAIPITAFIANLALGGGPKAILFVAMGISGYIAFRLWRIIKWNSNGVEVFDFESGALKYWAEMGNFKDAQQELGSLDFEWDFLAESDQDSTFYRLSIWDATNSIDSVLNLDEKTKEEIHQQLLRKHKALRDA